LADDQNGSIDKAEAELAAMSAIRKALADLEDDSRDRVFDWVLNFYGRSSSREQRQSPRQPTLPQQRQSSEPERADADTGNDQFADFAAFYHAANPATEAERALVGGYWFQVLQKKSDFEAAEVNKALNNLGFRIGNIAARLTDLMALRPAPVIQTGKSSSVKQAHKQYRLTDHGSRRVRQMIASGNVSPEP
jgi:hypothetical protein